jgi:hypothetical protein
MRRRLTIRPEVWEVAIRWRTQDNGQLIRTPFDPGSLVMVYGRFRGRFPHNSEPEKPISMRSQDRSLIEPNSLSRLPVRRAPLKLIPCGRPLLQSRLAPS